MLASFYLDVNSHMKMMALTHKSYQSISFLTHCLFWKMGVNIDTELGRLPTETGS